jgi:hypothetical protein
LLWWMAYCHSVIRHYWNATCLETSTTKGKATLGVAGLCPVTNRRSKIPR